MDTPSTISRLDDARLEQRCLAGDRAAAAELLTRCRSDLVGYCYRYLGNVDDAEDAVQDVATALTTAGTPKTSARAWLFRVARNRCLNQIKRRKDGRVGIGTFFADSQLPSPRTGPGTAIVRQELSEELRWHLLRLPPEQAEVLSLRYLDGMSRKEVAEVLELPESVVKSRIFHAVHELRRRGVLGAREDP